MNPALLAAMLLAAAPKAGLPDVKVSARLGVSGFSASEGWNYVIADLSNRGEEATCELRMPASLGDQVVYCQRVVLPKQSRKRVFLYFRPGAAYLDSTFKAFVDAEEGPLVEVPFFIRLRPRTQAVAVIGRRVGLNSYLLGLKTDPCRACLMPPEDTPDLWKGYTLFNAVVLSNCDPTRMSPAQQTALVNWVKAGGKLILAGGLAAGRRKGTLLWELCPVATATTRTSDAGAIARWCKPKPPTPQEAFDGLLCVDADTGRGSPLLAAKGRTFISRFRFGLGQIDFLCFDPAEKQFRTWPGRGKFWGKLLAMDFESLLSEVHIDGALRALASPLTAGTGRPVASYAAATAFVGAYVFVIGPLTYILLKRSRRYSLYAAVLLLTIALFSMLACGLCSWLNEAKHVVNVVSFVDVPSTWGFMSGHSFVASYRSRPQPLSVTFRPGHAAARPIERDLVAPGKLLQSGRPTKMRIVSSPDKLTIGMPEPVWRLYGWAAQWVQTFPNEAKGAAGLRHALKLLGGGLKQCHVLTKDDIHFIGDLSADDMSLPLREHVAALRKGLDHSLVCDEGLPAVLFRAERDRLRLLQLSFAQGSTSRERPGYPLAARASESRLSLRSRLDAGQAYLFGWARECPFAVQCPGASPSLRSIILARIELPPGSFAAAVE